MFFFFLCILLKCFFFFFLNSFCFGVLRGEGLCLSFTVPLCFPSLCSFITLSQLGLGLSLLGKLPSDRWQKQPRAPCPQLLPLCSVPGDRLPPLPAELARLCSGSPRSIRAHQSISSCPGAERGTVVLPRLGSGPALPGGELSQGYSPVFSSRSLRS